MLTGEVTLVAAIRDFFGIEGAKMVNEFKELSTQDKIDLENMLRNEGYNIKRPS